MAVDNTAKKSNYISRVVANEKAYKAARDEATKLRDEIASDGAIAGIVDGDCVGANSHMTRTIIDNYLGVTGDFEKCLTNQAVATSNRLPSFLAPNDGTS